MNNLKLKTIANTLIFLLLLGIVSCSPKVQTAIAEWSDCKDTCEQKKKNVYRIAIMMMLQSKSSVQEDA